MRLIRSAVVPVNSMKLLGHCQVGLGNELVGFALLEQAVLTSRRVLGEGHPSTEHFVQTLQQLRGRSPGR